MKIIVFFDIDGALLPFGDKTIPLHILRNFKRIIDSIDSNVILCCTSSRRLVPGQLEKFCQQLREFGITQPITATENRISVKDAHERRQQEIVAVVRQYQNAGYRVRFVVIDDLRIDQPISPISPHCVITNPRLGLTPTNAQQAIYLLNSDNFVDTVLLRRRWEMEAQWNSSDYPDGYWNLWNFTTKWGASEMRANIQSLIFTQSREDNTVLLRQLAQLLDSIQENPCDDVLREMETLIFKYVSARDSLSSTTISTKNNCFRVDL